MADQTTDLAAPRFDAGIEQILDRAARFCADRRSRLTDIRRQVLGLILQSGTPIGAYDLLDRLRDDHRGAAPPTVYRALEFLEEQGLVHRISRLSAFVGCVHSLDCDHGGECGHRAQFLLCQRCGAAQEIEDRRIGAALARAASGVGFTIGQATIEIEGVCAACRTAPDEAAARPRTATPRVG